MGGAAALAVQDPPYNLAAFRERTVDRYIDWCRRWVANTLESLAEARGGMLRNANLRLTLERTLARVAEAL